MFTGKNQSKPKPQTPYQDGPRLRGRLVGQNKANQDTTTSNQPKKPSTSAPIRLLSQDLSDHFAYGLPMEPQRFIQSYTCECFQPHNYCNCPYKPKAAGVLLANVREVATTLAEVMHLCGIPSNKAKLSVDVIIYYFLHFEENRSRIDAIPRKRLFWEDLLHDLNRKCCMQRMEAQMAWSIIKRAFRAFYHGTGEGGVPNPMLLRQLIHTQECMWAHAANGTAKTYASYEGIFLITQKDLERQIKILYKKLYDRLSSAQQPNESHECACANCAKRIAREGLRTAKVTTRMHNVADPFEEMYRQIVEQMLSKREDNSGNGEPKVKNHKSCTCPSLDITEQDQIYQAAAESCNTGYSQGPFACHWFTVDKEDYEAGDKEPELQLPEEFTCADCKEDGSSCDWDSVEEGGEIAFRIEDEEDLSEEALISDQSNTTDKPFSLKYSGCKKPFFKETIPNEAESIIAQIRRTECKPECNLDKPPSADEHPSIPTTVSE